MEQLLAMLKDLVREVVREELARERASAEHGRELLTTKEASAVAKVSADTIRAWAKTGRLKVQRVGRQMRINRADLDHALANPGPRNDRDEKLSPQELARRALARVLGD
jgi:excisionase family DNA binding protein